MVQIGDTEGVIPPAEQVPGERYDHGMRIKCYVVGVSRGIRGPQITLSRTHPNLVRKLFALEVPEIADGTVEICAIAREAGHRFRIAAMEDRYRRLGVHRNSHWAYLASIIAMHVNWNCWTLIGIAVGTQMKGLDGLGLEFAAIATFIGMVVQKLRTPGAQTAAAVAGILAALLAVLPYKAGLTIATLVAIAVAVMVAVAMFDYAWLGALAPLVYLVMIGLLLLVLALGTSVLGAQRSVNLGGISFQFSEVAKVLMIVVLAKYFADRSDKIGSPLTIAGGLVLLGPPTLLVYRQPDLGTSLVFVAIFFGMAFISLNRDRRTRVRLNATTGYVEPIINA